MERALGMGLRDPSIYQRDKPPPGYIPGIGRGAIGFMTRSDVGPASAQPELGGAGRGEGGAGGSGSGDGTVPGGAGDRFSGDRELLFANAPYEADDAEADRIYAEIDARMDGRTKRKREVKEEEEAKRAKMDSSRVADQFGDLKRDLAKLTAEEWEGIPDIGDYSLKYKQKKPEMFMPVPDNVIELGRSDNKLATAIDPSRGGGSGGSGGGAGGAADAAAVTDIRSISAARGQMLTLRLDRMSDNVSGQTTVNPQGYLTELGSRAGTSDADIADVKKARLLLKSVVTTNPRHGPGWIAAARLEEQVRNMPAARKLIKEGCEHCPDDEDVWLEAARLQTPQAARLVLADAVKHLPHSVKVWMTAAELEADIESKKAVMRKALTLIPASEKLWKAAISLEQPDDARIMLSRAVECVPASLDMWLALARLETYENAQRVLNQARMALPTEPLIWITAAKLEEAQGHGNMVDTILTRALKSLSAKQVLIDRQAWIQHAEDAERACAPATCAAIIKAVLDVGVEEADRRRTWLADAEALQERGSVETARAVYARTLQEFRTKEDIWLRAAQLEKKHGTPDTLDALLRRAVSACPQADVLWLMAAKERWLAGSVADARTILREAFAASPDSEQIWLAAVKLEWENDEFERARALLERARSQAPSDRVWMKSALLERELQQGEAEMRLLVEGVNKYPHASKLWMMLGQAYEAQARQRAAAAASSSSSSSSSSAANPLDRAREAFHAGLKQCPACIPLWRLAAALEERLYGVAKARSLLEQARLRCPHTPELWIEAIRLERRAGNEKLAETLMAKALQDCPNSGKLWAEDIETAPRPAQKRKSVDALKRCDTDPHVVLAVARLFWQDRKYDKARKWFQRAVTLDADLGDAWIWYAAFEAEQGDDASRSEVEEKCGAAAPAHGERWQAIAKHPANRRLTKVQILKKGVQDVQAAERGKRAAAFEGAGSGGSGGSAGSGAGARPAAASSSAGAASSHPSRFADADV